MATDTLSKEIGTWKAQIANVKARLPEMPQLGPTVQELEGVIVEGEELQSIQDVHRSQLRETTLRSKEIRRRGRSLRNQLVAGVQSVFGVDSLVLLELRRQAAPAEAAAPPDAGREDRQAGSGARGVEALRRRGRREEGLILRCSSLPRG